MADSLFLNLWFPSFTEAEMLPRLACVLKHFPFSATKPGIGYVEVHSVSWNEPTVFQETFDYRADPERAIALASEFLHDDNGYVFEAMWDLWSPGAAGERWKREPHPVKFIVHGGQFEDGAGEESGNIQIDLGLDSQFLFEQEGSESAEGRHRVAENIQQLVNFSAAIEKNCGTVSRLLWSESEENLPQKLTAQLQRLQ